MPSSGLVSMSGILHHLVGRISCSHRLPHSRTNATNEPERHHVLAAVTDVNSIGMHAREGSLLDCSQPLEVDRSYAWLLVEATQESHDTLMLEYSQHSFVVCDILPR